MESGDRATTSEMQRSGSLPSAGGRTGLSTIHVAVPNNKELLGLRAHRKAAKPVYDIQH